MAWFLEDANGLVVAGPFEYLGLAKQWAIDHPSKTKTLLLAVDLTEPLEPIAIVGKMTPALQDLQASGDVVCVLLPFEFVAVYLM